MKRHVIGVLSLFLLLAPAAEAVAKDVCVMSDSGVTIVFRKVAPLNPGGVIPLTGLYVTPGVPGAPYPCIGAAAMNADGSRIQVGIFCHVLLDKNSFAWDWTATDQTLAGSGTDDENGDN